MHGECYLNFAADLKAKDIRVGVSFFKQHYITIHHYYSSSSPYTYIYVLNAEDIRYPNSNGYASGWLPNEEKFKRVEGEERLWMRNLMYLKDGFVLFYTKLPELIRVTTGWDLRRAVIQ